MLPKYTPGLLASPQYFMAQLALVVRMRRIANRSVLERVLALQSFLGSGVCGTHILGYLRHLGLELNPPLPKGRGFLVQLARLFYRC